MTGDSADASALQDLLRTEADGFSRAEAQEYMATQGEQLQQDLDRAAAEAENADAFRASADVVRETIKTQLTQAGVFRDAVNDAYAAVPASFYAVTAAKLGVTPEQLYQQYPLTVGAQLPTDAAVFNQFAADPQTETSAFKRWFGDSKVVDAQGKPRVVYHGTNGNEGGDAFTYFDTYASNYGLMGQGAYFTDNPDVANSYTTKGKGDTPTVYKAFLSIQNPIDMDAKADSAKWQEQFDGIEEYHDGGDTNESWYRAAEDLPPIWVMPSWPMARKPSCIASAPSHIGNA